MSVPLSAWSVVLGGVIAVLAVDLVAHRGATAVPVKEAAWWSALWVGLVVFALILTAFAVPRAYQHRVLFYRVVGALVKLGSSDLPWCWSSSASSSSCSSGSRCRPC